MSGRACAGVLLLAAAAGAQDLSAGEIVRRSRAASAMGLLSGRAEIRMVVTDAGGSRERLLSAWALQQAGETRRLVRFKAPAEVAGVAFLLIEQDGRDPQRLLWLPAQKRVRRVGAGQGGQAFMQTDFSYADLELAGGGGEKHERLADAEVEGEPCYVIRTTAPGSPYRSVVTSIHRKTFIGLQIQFHGDEGLVKTLRVKRLKQVRSRWYAVESVMERADGRSKTELTVTSLDPEAAVAADELSERALERG